jgi:hypothetical protein
MGKSKDLASGAAYQDQTESDTRYVNTAGDTMTGRLHISGNTTSYSTSPILQFDTTSTNANNRKWAVGPADDSYGNFHIFKAESQSDTDPVDNAGQTLTITKDGYVTKPNQPSFAVTKNNGHVTAGNVYICNSTEYSVGSMYNTSNGRGTAPVAGRYFVSTWLMSEADATYNNKNYQIRKNGGIFKSVYSANGGNNHHQWSWAGLMNLSANDYIDVYANNMTLYGTSAYYSSFCMHLLS